MLRPLRSARSRGERPHGTLAGAYALRSSRSSRRRRAPRHGLRDASSLHRLHRDGYRVSQRADAGPSEAELSRTSGRGDGPFHGLHRLFGRDRNLRLGPDVGALGDACGSLRTLGRAFGPGASRLAGGAQEGKRRGKPLPIRRGVLSKSRGLGGDARDEHAVAHDLHDGGVASDHPQDRRLQRGGRGLRRRGLSSDQRAREHLLALDRARLRRRAQDLLSLRSTSRSGSFCGFGAGAPPSSAASWPGSRRGSPSVSLCSS